MGTDRWLRKDSAVAHLDKVLGTLHQHPVHLQLGVFACGLRMEEKWCFSGGRHLMDSLGLHWTRSLAVGGGALWVINAHMNLTLDVDPCRILIGSLQSLGYCSELPLPKEEDGVRFSRGGFGCHSEAPVTMCPLSWLGSAPVHRQNETELSEWSRVMF